MQNDTNTKGCTQWFYFSVMNHNKGKARFKIMNFVNNVIILVQASFSLRKRNENFAKFRQWKIMEKNWNINPL
jgi:hypothetical protein